MMKTTYLSIALLMLLVVSTAAQRGRGGAPAPPTAPTPPGPPRVEELKREAAAEIETMRVMTQQMVDQYSVMASWVSRNWRRRNT